jgi:hypothetical protein
MRTIALLSLAVVLGGAGLAAAEIPYACSSAVETRVKLTPDQAKLRVKTKLIEPANFDPAANGLELAVSYEPETDPTNMIFTATLPAASFQVLPTGWRYADPTGAVNGVIRVVLRNAPPFRKLKIVRKGAPLPVTPEERDVRVAVSSGPGACARSCPAPCRVASGKLACKSLDDSAFTTLCGTRSGCELLGAPPTGAPPSSACLLPYPSDFFLADDPSTPTGKRVAYDPLVTPANASGVHISNVPYASLDGFSPGSMALVNFPTGVDLVASNVPPYSNPAASVDPGSPTVLIEADSPGCTRVLHFGENDVSVAPGNVPVAPPDQAFIIRPLVRLKNATRYIVALRGLVDQQASLLQAPLGFAALRDGTPSGLPVLEARRAHVDSVIDKLETDCGIARSSLVLAWDFTTASDDAIERWLIHMRDTTFAQLGPANAPAFTVNTVEDPPLLNSGGTQPDPRICRRVTGTYTVPLFTTADGPGSVLNLDPMTNLPVQNGTTQAPFSVVIPCSLVAGPTAGRPIFYGHGLLGSGAGEVTAGNLRDLADNHGFVLAATDWQGFSNADLGTVLSFITDLSNFRKLPERSHQGILNQLVLARLLGAPNGFSSDPAFQVDLGGGNFAPLIDPTEVYYYGNSQGGILGGVVMALAQETTRGVLGVPGANFSTLLQRSIDFEPYFALLRVNYPDNLGRMITYPLLQQLWDRAEPNGWYHQTLAGGVPNTPAHKLLIHMARGDDEVANLATTIMVRSLGIPQVDIPIQSYFGIPVATAPFDGSAMVESDFGVPPVPTTNIPPPDNAVHGQMRALAPIQQQISQFLQPAGDIQQFCSGSMCNPD